MSPRYRWEGPVQQSGGRHWLDEKTGFFGKLGTSLIIFMFGVAVGPLLYFGVTFNNWGVWGGYLVRFCFEAIVFFWVFLLIIIWWRPLWLRRIYLHYEMSVVIICKIFYYVLVFGILCMAGYGLMLQVGWL
jgi:hypothetical protein